jgi:hypothetical protein
LFPSLVLALLVSEPVLKNLIYLRILLGLVHDLLERLRQSVLLKVLLKYSVLPNLGLTDFVQVYLFVV